MHLHPCYTNHNRTNLMFPIIFHGGRKIVNVNWHLKYFNAAGWISSMDFVLVYCVVKKRHFGFNQLDIWAPSFKGPCPFH